MTNFAEILKKILVTHLMVSILNFHCPFYIQFIENFFQRFFSMFRNKKMLSVYPQNIIGFSSKALRIFSSNSLKNKLAYTGANFVSIAVSYNFLKVFSSNSKMMFLALFQQVLEICFLSLDFKNLRKEVTPSLCM